MAFSKPKGRIGPVDLQAGDVVFPVGNDRLPWMVLSKEGNRVRAFCFERQAIVEQTLNHEEGNYGGRVMVFRGGEEINMTYDPSGVMA